MSKRPRKPEASGDDAKAEYDFTGAARGQFYRPEAILVRPVHLEPEVLAYLQARADARGTTLSDLVNALLKKDIELIEMAQAR